MRRTLHPILLLAALAIPLTAAAEKADRSHPVTLEADKVTVDDRQQLHIYDGNVVLKQGSLEIKASRLTVKQDADGYQKGIATGGAGGLATFRQKREGRNDFVEGEAERIEHDNRSERTEFFARAHVKSGLDEVTGTHIVYDARNENYTVTGAATERVRARIEPRNKNEPPAAVSKDTKR